MKIFNKKNNLIAAASVTILLTGCSTLKTTVVPMEDGNYRVIATAGSESTTRSGAVKQGEQVCAKRGGTFKVVHMNTTYQGIGKQVTAISDAASTAAWMNHSKAFIPNTHQTNDYKTTLVFKCQ